MQRTKNREDLEFISAQRGVERRGYMARVDKNEEKKDARILKRKAAMDLRQNQAAKEKETLLETVALVSDDNNDDQGKDTRIQHLYWQILFRGLVSKSTC